MREWRGDDAGRLLVALAASSEYPRRHRYWIWPGPNSNTYPAWVLRRAGVYADLPPRAIGKDYLGLLGLAVTTTGTGLQLETPLFGVKLGLLDGLELHLFALTLLGIDFWPPALKTPLGLLGFSEEIDVKRSRSE